MSGGPSINLDFHNESFVYSDGEAENELLSIFKREGSAAQVREILANSPSWPLYYHLSPVRENLLSWFDFNSKGSLLEVGAGCGALTGLFCKKLEQVTALELTKLRAEVIFNRHRSCSNLEVIVGNLMEISLNKSFDYITSIGVLEYAARFIASEKPHHFFLRKLYSLLKPGGTLLLAIENKFGLKYWAGCKEDHTGRLFESIEDYPKHDGVNTFGRPELLTLLSESGFGNSYFYYPLPDYKLPIEIFSDEYLPRTNHPPRSTLFPTHDPSNSREYLLDEQLAMGNIIKNDAFPFFANSFLVLAQKPQ